jgi:succinate dehydrogenase/fumarate reductase flavoprotein subunit
MEKTFEQTRRSFIKGAAATVLGTVGMGADALASEKAGANDAVTSVGDIKWDEEYDVLIVGSGAAGLAAACTVATEGDGATALLLEKGGAEWGNGNSIFSSGICTYTDDVESYGEYLKEMRGDFTATPDDVLEAFAEGLGENYDWIVNTLGANPDEITLYTDKDFPTEWAELPHSGGRLMFQFNKDNESGNTHIARFLSNKVLGDYSDVITQRTNAPLLALIQDPATDIVLGGVYQGQDGSNVYVRASRGVIMCTGGFENDPVMKQDFIGFPISHPAAGECNTGDGHRICARLGASFWHMESFAGSWTNGIKLDGSEMLNYRGLRKAQGITVGVNGRRFYADWEGSTMFEPSSRENDLSLQYGCRHGKFNFGGDYTHLPMPSHTWFVFDSDGLSAGAYLGTNSGTVSSQTGSSEGNAADPVTDGYAYVSDTIEGLAERMSVPADELAKTVQTWNESCANGDDEFFHRAASTLTPVRTAPFYAIPCVPEILNTDGGPRRDAKGEILDVDGNPIPHLYSAGEFGSVWSNKYEGCGNIGECCAFGRISARSALANM